MGDVFREGYGIIGSVGGEKWVKLFDWNYDVVFGSVNMFDLKNYVV